MQKKLLIFIIILSSFISILSTLQTYATTCGSSFFNSCPDMIKYCIGNTCSMSGGLASVQQALNGQLTNTGIAEYSQKIVVYLMGFISLIAVIYIIYAGFQLMIGAGDEEKMKKMRQIITYVIIGILIMWLAFPIVKWTLNLIKGTTTTYEWSVVQNTNAASYTESDYDTFATYKEKIREAANQIESEYMVNQSVRIQTLQNAKNLVQAGFDRLPDYGESASINKEAKQSVDTYIDLAIRNPNNSSHIGNAISRISNFAEQARISRITGNINAGPVEGNAPLTVSFRAENVADPSGTTPADNNYIWWTRENGGYRREIGRGPSLSFTFTKEGTYTVFLDVISGSRNSKGKTDVLALSTSQQINIKPRVGQITLLVNGVNVTNMKQLKISPTLGKMGVIFDATASRAIGNGAITETQWDFGNGNESTNPGGPIVERQLYVNPSGYVVKVAMKTNDGQTFNKELQLLVRDPAAVIKLDKETGNIGEDISMSANSYFSDTKNVEYSWQIQNEDGKKVVKTADGNTFTYKFDSIGSYIITLTTKSPNGDIDTDSKMINIESRPPIVTMDSPRPIKSEKPNIIIFDASKSYDPDTSSKKNLSYTWKIDGENINLDNTENNGSRGTYTFDEKGSHRVSLTVANSYGKVTTVEKDFEVTSTLSVNVITTPKVTTRGSPMTLVAQSPNAEFYEWNMGDGSPIVSGTNRTVQYTYKQSGTYNVSVTVSRDSGTETNTTTQKVYVVDADSPFAIIESSNSSNTLIEEKGACNGMDALLVNRSDTTTFNGANSINTDGTPAGLSYTWKYFGKAKTTSQISEKFNELGCFPIELTVRSNKNGATHTATQYIKLENNPPELTSITNTVDTAKKDSQKVLVKVRANGAIDPDGVITSYIWYYTTESDDEPQNVQVTNKNEITFVLPNVTEKYYFGVILEDNDGAKINSMELGQSPSSLTIDNSNGNINLPLISLSGPKKPVNTGEKVRFSADVRTIMPGVNITNKVEYAWDFDGDGRIDEKSMAPSVEHIYNHSGDYNMKVRVTNNGVSNSKYMTVNVRNKLKAKFDGYKLPDNSIYFLNTSEGTYNKAHWKFGSNESENLTALHIDSGATETTGTLTITSSDDEVDTIQIDSSKLETLGGTGMMIISSPRIVNDTITLNNPNDTITLSLIGNNADNYAIDTDALIDSNLDGIPDNDIDNKDDISYTDGSAFTIRDLGSTSKKERKIQVSLIKNGNVVQTKSIKVFLSYISDTTSTMTDVSSSGAVGLSTADRQKLEELSKMIRELNDSDRIVLMQRYNILVENWNDPFDKAKSLIDIQEGINTSAIDNDKKVKISKVIDELLIGDAQVTDEISIAVHLIRDLIPKESPNRDTLLSKLSEIESHPTLLETNRTIGKEMLVLIEKDSTIPDKYKLHIKNQFSIIVSGGSQSVSSETPVQKDPDPSKTGGILGFIGGFVKIFFIIIGIVLVIGIIAFIFYRLSRKSDNMGFQDFLIDAVFHSGGAKDETSIHPESSGTTKDNISPIPHEDPLKTYTPPVFTQEQKTIDPLQQATTQPQTTENIPDWLKVPSSLDTTPVHQDNQSHTEELGNSTAINFNNEPESHNDDVSGSSPAEHTNGAPTSMYEDPISSNLHEESQDSTYYGISDQRQNGPHQDETHVDELPENTSQDDIPDWIKTPSASEAKTDEVPSSTPANDSLPDWLMDSIKTNEDTSTDTEISQTQEQLPETENPSIEEKREEGENAATVPKKEKKPRGAKKTQSEETTTPKNETDNLPDWLK